MVGALAAAALGKPDLAPFLALRLGRPRDLLPALRNEAARRLGLDRAARLTTLNVELTSRCNVVCSYCDVNHELGRPARDLELSVLERLLDETPGLTTLLPFQWGEPLLHPGLVDAVAMGSARGLSVYLTTNGTLLDGQRFAAFSRAGLTRLTVSLDGDAASHQRRRGYAQEPILERLAEARAVRDRLRLPTALDVSMVVDDQVTDQLEAFSARLAPLCDRVQLLPKMVEGVRRTACREPSRGLAVVLSDGRLTTCCADVRGDLALGHVDEGPLAQQYAGAKWTELRARHRRKAFDGPCASCDECAVPGVSKRFG
jgi:organic radical activating enzyme